MLSTKFCHLGDLASEICACLTKVFLKTTIFHQMIIEFLYVYKILSVCCQDIFADECGYKRTVCFEGPGIFINIILDVITLLGCYTVVQRSRRVKTSATQQQKPEI